MHGRRLRGPRGGWEGSVTVRYTRTTHLCLNIAGALRRRSLKGWFTDDEGREMSDREARDHLRMEQHKGHRVIPMGKCDNFDYQTGCKGHGHRFLEAMESQSCIHGISLDDPCNPCSVAWAMEDEAPESPVQGKEGPHG